MPLLSDDQLESLVTFLEEGGFGKPPQAIVERPLKPNFRPGLNPKQAALYDSKAIYILAHAERATGKTWGGLHKLVHHCFHNRNALGVVVVGVRRQAEEGGAWYKLNTFILPEWRHGANLVFSEPKTNLAKDVFVWISNKFGGWSKILLLSMPVGSVVADRFKGPEPSFILVDEAQTLQSDTYFKTVVQQIGRRSGIELQQIVYCANPAGRDHWLYQRFFINPIDPKTGKMDPRYAVFHIPISENAKNLPAGYYENVIEAVRGDDTEYRRMVLGEWVDQPTDGAIFEDDFVPEKHVRGNAIQSIGILPVVGHDVILGWDLGSAHSCISIQQDLIFDDADVWVVFDEVNYVDKYMPYYRLVPKLIDRLRMWEKKLETEFRYKHISDNSAFNQFRAKDGSFDHQDIERLSREYVKEKGLPDRFIIRMIECPKGPYSIKSRIRGTKERLQSHGLLISATCYKTVDAMRKLEIDPKEQMNPKRSIFIHPYDAMSYAHHYFNSKGIRAKPQTDRVMEPKVYAAA